MYISIGEKSAALSDDIIGVFDIERTTVQLPTRQFLANAEQLNIVTNDTEGIPRSFLVSRRRGKDQVRLSICSSATISDRQNSSYTS